jgi:D-aminopeptidase
VQSNFGARRNLTIRGSGLDLAEPAIREATRREEKSSIIGVVATDAPFLAHQMRRLARRMPLGVALTGGYGYTTSGDIFLAFTTANAEAVRAGPGRLSRAEFIPDADIDPFFDAVVQTMEEAILNALVANEDMTGRDGNFVPALPKEQVRRLFADR